MKKILLLISIITSLTSTALAQKHALIIAIANYPESSEWQAIHSDNDAELISSTLKNGFEIVTLTDSKATYRNIISQLRNLELKTEKGDTVLIHFSCHGQQMIAANDKNEPDGLDECLIPYDARKTKSSSYNGQNHLKDNELNNYIRKIMAKAGGKGLVLVSIDACHSDSMDRGDDDDDTPCTRGTYDIFGIASEAQTEELRRIYRNQDSKAISKSDSEANVIYLSACLSYQSNYETRHNGKFYGSLTLCMCQAIRENGFGDVMKWISATSLKMRQISQFGQKMSVRSTIK